MDIKNIMDYLIERTFDVLREVYNNQSEGKASYITTFGRIAFRIMKAIYLRR